MVRTDFAKKNVWSKSVMVIWLMSSASDRCSLLKCDVCVWLFFSVNLLTSALGGATTHTIKVSIHKMPLFSTLKQHIFILFLFLHSKIHRKYFGKLYIPKRSAQHYPSRAIKLLSAIAITISIHKVHWVAWVRESFASLFWRNVRMPQNKYKLSLLFSNER